MSIAAAILPSDIAEQLGGKRVFGEVVSTWAGLQEHVVRGLPKSAAQHLVRAFAPGPGDTTMPVAGASAPAALIASPATMKRSGPLSLDAGERAVRLARLLSLAEKALGNRARAVAWLGTAHPMLGKATPLSLARTELGGRQVERMLANLLYDLPA